MPLWFLDLRLDSDYLTSIIVILGIWSKSAATGAVTVIYGGLSHCYDHCARSYSSSRRWLPIIIIPMPAITVMIIILASTVIPFFLPFSLLTLLFPSLLFVFALFLHSLFLLATRLFQPVLRALRASCAQHTSPPHVPFFSDHAHPQPVPLFLPLLFVLKRKCFLLFFFTLPDYSLMLRKMSGLSFVLLFYFLGKIIYRYSRQIFLTLQTWKFWMYFFLATLSVCFYLEI